MVNKQTKQGTYLVVGIMNSDVQHIQHSTYVDQTTDYRPDIPGPYP